jgi:DNA-binding response OmpR family regulator
VARDGQKGLDLARREDFALIILDRMLPAVEAWRSAPGCGRKAPQPDHDADGQDELQNKIDGLKAARTTT